MKTAPLEKRSVHWIFVGGDGLRSGWCVALYLSSFILITVVELWCVKSLHSGALWSEMLQEFGLLSAALLASLIMSRIELRSWDAYGLPVRGLFSTPFWIGAIWGFLALTALLGGLYGLRVFDLGHLALRGMRIVEFAAFWGLMCLLVGLFEEFLFRGYAQFTLARGIGFWPAAAVFSFLWGGLHLITNPGESWAGALAGFVMGIFLCLTLQRTGSLWFAVGFHASWDWGESFLYSVPDSGQIAPGHLLSSSFHGPRWLTGGSVGPEGSLLCFVVIIVALIMFNRIYPGLTRA